MMCIKTHRQYKSVSESKEKQAKEYGSNPQKRVELFGLTGWGLLRVMHKT
jgi:hypothetical protein